MQNHILSYVVTFCIDYKLINDYLLTIKHRMVRRLATWVNVWSIVILHIADLYPTNASTQKSMCFLLGSFFIMLSQKVLIAI